MLIISVFGEQSLLQIAHPFIYNQNSQNSKGTYILSIFISGNQLKGLIEKKSHKRSVCSRHVFQKVVGKNHIQGST